MTMAFKETRVFGIFQQDIAPCNTSKKGKNLFKQNVIKVLDWPGNSTDLSPIENYGVFEKDISGK